MARCARRARGAGLRGEVGATAAGTAFDVAAGLALVALALPRGPVHSRHGDGERWTR